MALDWLWWRAWVVWSPRLVVWQAWPLVTSTFTLRGRRGAWQDQRSFCVASLALMALDWLWWRAWVLWSPRLFAWQAWRLVTSTFTLRGRRGACRHRPFLSVAGVALMALDWLWWRAWALAWQAWRLVTSTVTLRGRRTYGTGLALVARLGALVVAAVCVAGVALGDIDLHFAWQAWRLPTSTFS